MNINEMTIELLVKENEALKCQLELIRSAWCGASLDIAALFRTQPQNQEDGSYNIDGQDCNDLGEIISRSPEQCLNSVKADAIDAAAMLILGNSDGDTCFDILNERANVLRGDNG